MEYAVQWLGGKDARLRRAAAQTLGLVVVREGPHAARRVAAWLPSIGAALSAQASSQLCVAVPIA